MLPVGMMVKEKHCERKRAAATKREEPKAPAVAAAAAKPEQCERGARDDVRRGRLNVSYGGARRTAVNRVLPIPGWLRSVRVDARLLWRANSRPS